VAREPEQVAPYTGDPSGCNHRRRFDRTRSPDL